MAIRNRILVEYNGETWLEQDGASQAVWFPRSTYLDLSNDASDRDDAVRRGQLELARQAQPIESVRTELELRAADGWTPIDDLWLHDRVSAPDGSDTADGFSPYVVDAVGMAADGQGYAIVTPEIGDRRLDQLAQQAAAFDRQTRGLANGRNRFAGSSQIVADEFDGIKAGKVRSINGPSFSKPNDVLVGSSGRWSPDVRARLTAFRIQSTLSGIANTVIRYKRGVIGDTTPVDFTPPLVMTLVAGARFTQGIMYNVLVTPLEYVVVQVTAAGGHTDINIQTSASPAI